MTTLQRVLHGATGLFLIAVPPYFLLSHHGDMSWLLVVILVSGVVFGARRIYWAVSGRDPLRALLPKSN